jgi:hypothetical protein
MEWGSDTGDPSTSFWNSLESPTQETDQFDQSSLCSKLEEVVVKMHRIHLVNHREAGAWADIIHSRREDYRSKVQCVRNSTSC